MVEDGKVRAGEKEPAIDPDGFKTWKMELEIYLVKKSQADEKLLPMPVSVPGGINSLQDRQENLELEMIL
jgi:hypothetical protein